MFVAFVYSVLFGIVCALVADRRGRSAWGWGVLGLVFGVFALAVLACLEVPRKQLRGQAFSPVLAPVKKTRACPFCAEQILSEAVKCRFCQSDVSPIAVVESAEVAEHFVRHNGVLTRVSDIPKVPD